MRTSSQGTIKVTVGQLKRLIREAVERPEDDIAGVSQRISQVLGGRLKLFEQAAGHLGDPDQEAKVLETMLRLVRGMRATLEAAEPILERRIQNPPQRATAWTQGPGAPAANTAGPFSQPMTGKG